MVYQSIFVSGQMPSNLNEALRWIDEKIGRLVKVISIEYAGTDSVGQSKWEIGYEEKNSQ
jgi:hypothetical protein